MSSTRLSVITLALLSMPGISSAADCNTLNLVPEKACITPGANGNYTVVYRLPTTTDCVMTRGTVTGNWGFPAYLRTWSMQLGTAAERRYQLVKPDQTGLDYTVKANPSTFFCVKDVGLNSAGAVSARVQYDFNVNGLPVIQQPDYTTASAAIPAELCSAKLVPASVSATPMTYDAYAASALGGGTMASQCEGTVSPPLPVKLVDFSARASLRSAVLSWETANEENFDYFAVERSTDGLSFSEIGTRAAAGGSLGARYEYVDNTALGGKYNYRLRMVDLDGTYKNSKTVSVTVDAGNVSQTIAPNPVARGATTRLIIRLQRAQPVSLQLIGSDGSLLQQRTVSLGSGIQVVDIQVPAQAGTGIHHLRVMADGALQTHKLFVQ